MTEYIVDDGEDITINRDGLEIDCYYKLYSNKQQRRFKKVLNQMMDIWYAVKDKVSFIRNTCGIDDSNFIMNKVHKLFLITHRDKINYYENIKRDKNFIKKKINKIKNKKQDI